MQQGNKPELERLELALRTVTESSEILFERAPVMMHSINRQGRLVKVNRRWLTTLGYEKDEVIGQISVNFLTDESRLRAIQDSLPLFWQAGSARSIGHRFLRKDGRVLSVLLDAEVVPGTEGDLSALATLRSPNNLHLWRQASTNLERFRKLTGVQRQLENLLLPGGGGPPDTGRPREPQLLSLAQDRTSAKELFGTIVELAQDISSSLSALSRLHHEWRDAFLEQQDELLLAMRSIDKTLIEMKDMATDLWSSE